MSIIFGSPALLWPKLPEAIGQCTDPAPGLPASGLGRDEAPSSPGPELLPLGPAESASCSSSSLTVGSQSRLG